MLSSWLLPSVPGRSQERGRGSGLEPGTSLILGHWGCCLAALLLLLATPGCALGLLLDLCLGVTPGGD